jgi:hypothetical protein
VADTLKLLPSIIQQPSISPTEDSGWTNPILGIG